LVVFRASSVVAVRQNDVSIPRWPWTRRAAGEIRPEDPRR